MKIITAKQEARLEKKKKKLAALAEVMKLNDKDRQQLKPTDEHPNENTAETTSSSASSEPKRKRQKCIESPADSENLTAAPVPDIETITAEQYVELKRVTNERKRMSRSKPGIRLNLLGDAASIKVEDSVRTPIFLTDIQHLIMAALFGAESPCSPSRWCVLEKRNRLAHTVVLVIEGVALFHYSSYASVFEETSIIFDHQLEVIMPPHQDGQIVDELMQAPLTDSQRTELIAKYGSLEAALEATQNQMLLVKTVFPIPARDDGTKEQQQSTTGDEIVPRTQLLLSALQLVDEGYPVPLRGDLANRYKDFVMTKDVYAEVTATSPMFGLDCEMCRTSAGFNELTRISIVDESYKSVYETLVRPDNKIIDYLTQYSGITCEMMANVTKTRANVQEDIRNLLPADAILVGQSLQSDLLAMRMMHPYVIDTSVIFNITGERRHKSKLQTLAMEFLGEKIQANPLGHDSIEDCSASLKLTKLKLVKGLYFGDEVLSGRKRANEKRKLAEEAGGTTSTTIGTTTNVKDTSTAIIISAETATDTEKYRRISADCKLITCYEVDNNKKAIRKTRDHCIENALTITHIKIPPQRLEVTKIEKTLSRVDRWIAGVWESVAPNGLFVVVLGGVPSVISGVAMMQIKRNLKIVQTK